jgi:hypothetical protein
MMRKIIFTAPFIAPAEPRRFASSVVTPWGYKAGMVAPTQPPTIPPPPFIWLKKRKIEKQI